MGLFNTIHTTIECPRCSQSAEVEVEVKFGWTNQIDYAVHDEVRWSSSLEFPPIDRPADGSGQFLGYCECSLCHKDFWVQVQVERDRIERIEVDLSKQGYIT
jgi:hypothetical protein